MKYCGDCGGENRQVALYCRHCGTSLEESSTIVSCVECGVGNHQHNLYCRQCGTSLGERSITLENCNECGGGNHQNNSYCQHCGTSLTDTPVTIDPEPQPKQKSNRNRNIVLIVGVIVLVVVRAMTCTQDNNEDSVEQIEPGSKNEAGATTRTLNRTPTFTPTPTPIPTASPTPVPIQIELSDLLEEYDQNKVRANTRFRYQVNGNIPVSTFGYVSEVEERYVIITTSQEQYSSQRVYCHYADTRAALQLTKGQFVSVTGKVRGTNGYSSRVTIFTCEFEGIQFAKNPTVSAQALRNNVVQVFCLSDSVFSSGYKGTGVIVDPKEGIVLTVHHVIADENECEKIELELPGLESRVSATIVKHCASIDRARLRISPQVLAGPPLQLVYRAAAPAQTDQEIYFWGYGSGELRMGTGIVMDTLGNNIVTDAYAVPGDSGSPVFDESGHLLGTVSRSNRSDRAVFTGDEC